MDNRNTTSNGIETPFNFLLDIFLKAMFDSWKIWAKNERKKSRRNEKVKENKKYIWSE